MLWQCKGVSDVVVERDKSSPEPPDIQIIEENHFDNRLLRVYAGRPQSLTKLLRSSVALYAEKEVLVDGDSRITYQDFQRQVDTLAYNLSQEWGAQQGDRVALLLNNSKEFCLSMFALAQLGVITVPLNTRLKSAEIQFMLDNSGARYLIADIDFWPELVEIKDKLTTVKEIFIVGSWYPEGTLPFANLQVPNPGGIMADIYEDDVAMIMYTSGTTGKPKGAMLTHLGMIHSAINYQQVMKTQSDERTLLVVPLFHVTGLIGQLIHILYIGGTAVLMRNYKTETMITLMEKESITFTFSVPTIYVLMLINPNFSTYNLSAWRLAAYGGAPMSEDTINKLADSYPNLRMHNAYGATETSSPATILPCADYFRKIASVGLPVPVGKCKVVDEKGRELPPNQPGELWIKGPHIVPGYWANPEANAREFSDGFWHSGDLAMMDEEDYVYILDRKKEMINRGGEKIFCVEVENVLYGHPQIMEAAVVGVPDQVFGEQVKAVVVPKPDQNLTVEEVREFVSGKLADYKVPKYVEFTDILPRNPGGKVIKALLKETINQSGA